MPTLTFYYPGPGPQGSYSGMQPPSNASRPAAAAAPLLANSRNGPLVPTPTSPRAVSKQLAPLPGVRGGPLASMPVQYAVSPASNGRTPMGSLPVKGAHAGAHQLPTSMSPARGASFTGVLDSSPHRRSFTPGGLSSPRLARGASQSAVQGSPRVPVMFPPVNSRSASPLNSSRYSSNLPSSRQKAELVFVDPYVLRQQPEHQFV